jgi:23S rRNA pseudouridine2605 synthase
MYKRESGSNDRNSGRSKGTKPFVKTTAAKKKTTSGPARERSFDKPAGKGFGAKKTYGKSGGDRDFDRAPRKTRSYGEEKSSGTRDGFKSRGDSKSFDKAPRKTRSYGDEKPYASKGRGDSKSFDKAPRKTRSYGDEKPYATKGRGDSKSFDKAPRKTRSYGDEKPYASKGRGDSKSFDKAPRKTRSYGDEKPYASKGRGASKSFDKVPRKTRSYDGDQSERSFEKRSSGYGRGRDEESTSFSRTPRKTRSVSEDKPARSGDRKNTRESGSETRRSSRSFSYKEDDKARSRSGRGPRKGEEPTEKKKAQKDETPQKGNIRLNRFIANAGICSRREADDLIMAGLVKVNGVVIEEMGYQVKPTDEVRYNNERLTREKKVYVLLNKPKDAVTTTEDPEGRRTVMQLFGNDLGERIYPVGRLDRNTTGVLLFTNDGDLAQRLMHPRYEMKKVYKATLNKTFKGEDMWQLTNGVELEDGFIKPDAVAYPDAKNKSEVGVEIHSGKNRIIHRIFESLGYKVDKLDRALYAGLTKGKLKRGEWRELTEKEVATLKRTVKLA